jgi:hypothetical protein
MSLWSILKNVTIWKSRLPHLDRKVMLGQTLDEEEIYEYFIMLRSWKCNEGGTLELNVEE